MTMLLTLRVVAQIGFISIPISVPLWPERQTLGAFEFLYAGDLRSHLAIWNDTVRG